MSDKKNPHILAIQQQLADFDIETQVKRITLQTMNAYMRGNKQAFEYIQDWESKFMQFQARLAKAETYYRNIEVNVNSKVEVTNSLHLQLEKFSYEFSQTIRDYSESYQQIRKNYTNLIKQSSAQSSTLRNLDRQLCQTNKSLSSLQSQIQSQTTMLTQKISALSSQLTLKNTQRKQQAKNIVTKIVEATALLESKSGLLEILGNDVVLYQQEKARIWDRIQRVYEELRGKLDATEFSKMRVYIDNSTILNTERIEVVYQELKKQVEEEIDTRIISIDMVRKAHKQQCQKNLKKFSEVQKIQKQKHEQSLILIEKLSKKIVQNFESHQQRFIQESERTSKLEQANEIAINRIEETAAILAEKSDIMDEIVSNISSINSSIKKMQIQTKKRGDQLAQLKIETGNTGDLTSQIKKITQKILSHDQLIDTTTTSVQSLSQTETLHTAQLRQTISNLSKSLQCQLTNFSTTNETTFTKIDQKYEQICAQIRFRIQERHGDLVAAFQNNIREKIDSIRDKFDFLQTVNADMEKFKATFQTQIQMNDQLNEEVKDKMNRMFNSITKLKTDSFVKMQTLNQQNLKISVRQKQLTKVLTQICSTLSHFNETLTIQLSSQLCSQLQNQGIEQYKVSSMIQGCVLELTKDKLKYRSQQTTKRALLQLCLEQLIRNGDKQKGTILENGKDVFARMSSGEDYQAVKKRSISRRKHRMSELPKVNR